MARPRKEGLDYFPHDTDASNDEKIEALRALYGNDGYAFYFIMLERIYRNSTFSIDVSDAENRQILARKVGVSIEQFDEMISFATDNKRNIFDSKRYQEKHILTSNGIKKRAKVVTDKRKKARSEYQFRKKVSDTETPQENSQKSGRNPTETRQRKVKESKGKESKEVGVGSPIYDDFSTIPESIKAHLRTWQHSSSAIWVTIQQAVTNDIPTEWIEAALTAAENANACNANYVRAALEGIQRDGGPKTKGEKAAEKKWYEGYDQSSNTECDKCHEYKRCVKLNGQWLCKECKEGL